MKHVRNGAIVKVREMLRANPSTPNRVICEECGCTNALVSRTRKQMGVPWRKQRGPMPSIVLPEHLIEWLSSEARQTGGDVTMQDIVIGILTDVKLDAEMLQAAE